MAFVAGINTPAFRAAVDEPPSMEDFSAAERAMHDAMARLRKASIDHARHTVEREYFALDALIQRGLLNYPQVYGQFLAATTDKPAHRAEVEKFLPPPFVPPAIIDPRDFRAVEAPPRKWLVPGWIPANDCTMIGADGGTGKTTIGVQLNFAMETQGLWLGLPVEAGPSIYCTAEEPRDEMHFRYRAAAAISCNRPVYPFDIISFADYEDAALIEIVDGKPQATELLHWLEWRAREIRAKLIVLAALADFCAINEVDRSQVRRAVAIFRGMAIRLNCAVILMAHPSVDGIKTGRGYSGSTHWNNAVRSRMYFQMPVSESKEENIDPDVRILSLEKANRARKGQSINLRWKDGVFVVDGFAQSMGIGSALAARNTFLRLLAFHQKHKINVSPNKGPTYAPAIFEKHKLAAGIKSATLKYAMDDLLQSGAIRSVEFGRAGKQRTRLIIADGIDTGEVADV